MEEVNLVDETNLSFKTIKLRLFSPEVKFLKQTGKNLSISVVQKQQKKYRLTLSRSPWRVAGFNPLVKKVGRIKRLIRTY